MGLGADVHGRRAAESVQCPWPRAGRAGTGSTGTPSAGVRAMRAARAARLLLSTPAPSATRAAPAGGRPLQRGASRRTLATSGGGRRDRGGEAVPGAALRVWENGTVPPPARPVPSDPGRVPPVPSLAQPRGGGHPTARLRQREAPELLRGPLAGCCPRAGVRRGCRCGSTEVRAAASPSLSRTLQSESKARRDWADDVISM